MTSCRDCGCVVRWVHDERQRALALDPTPIPVALRLSFLARTPRIAGYSAVGDRLAGVRPSETEPSNGAVYLAHHCERRRA